MKSNLANEGTRENLLFLTQTPFNYMEHTPKLPTVASNITKG